MTQIGDLPLELLVKILLYLQLDLLGCKRLSKFFLDLINKSAEINYYIQLQISGMIDNPRCNLPISERLLFLNARENAWEQLKPTPATDIDISFKPSGLYGVTSSTCMLGLGSAIEDNSTDGLQILSLPTKFPRMAKADNVGNWTTLKMDMTIINFGSAVEEHDLLVFVVKSPNKENPEQTIIKITLLRYSTQELHDGSQNPIFTIMEAEGEWGNPSAQAAICGENLAVAVTFPTTGNERDRDYMCIFNWKTGKEKLEPWRIPLETTLVFLQEDLLLYPMCNSLYILHVPSSADLSLNKSQEIEDGQAIHFRILRVLSLPPLQPDYSYKFLSCRSLPNPTADGAKNHLYYPQDNSKPYTNDPRRAVILLKTRVSNTLEHRTFNIIMHRQALLDLIPLSMLQITQAIADGLRNPVYIGATGGFTEAHLIVMRLDAIKLVKRPWVKWGPPATRWLGSDGFSDVFVDSTYGERCVRYTVKGWGPGSEEENENLKNTIQILDFNTLHIRRALSNELTRDDLHGNKLCTISVVGTKDDENITPAGDMFDLDVVGRLPYMKSTCRCSNWEYDSMMVSEEILIGMRTEYDTDQVKAIGLVHLG